jgi:hypothetical protein
MGRNRRTVASHDLSCYNVLQVAHKE